MGDQRERNRIKSRVDELPDEIRAQLDAMLADVNYTYQDIADTITDLGYEISRTKVYKTNKHVFFKKREN